MFHVLFRLFFSQRGRTALHESVSKNQSSVIKSFVKHGADLHKECKVWLQGLKTYCKNINFCVVHIFAHSCRVASECKCDNYDTYSKTNNCLYITGKWAIIGMSHMNKLELMVPWVRKVSKTD